jgi:hypothetical protein
MARSRTDPLYRYWHQHTFDRLTPSMGESGIATKDRIWLMVYIVCLCQSPSRSHSIKKLYCNILVGTLVVHKLDPLWELLLIR